MDEVGRMMLGKGDVDVRLDAADARVETEGMRRI